MPKPGSATGRGTTGRKTTRAQKMTFERMVGRALEDQEFQAAICSPTKSVRKRALEGALGRPATATEEAHLTRAISAMRRLRDRFGPQPIAT